MEMNISETLETQPWFVKENIFWITTDKEKAYVSYFHGFSVKNTSYYLDNIIPKRPVCI